MPRSDRTPIPIFFGIALLACSMLIYEVLLTRLSALRLEFHFTFLVISNCLLGVGAGGTLISIFQDRWRARARHWIWLFTLLYVVSVVLAYAFAITVPLAERVSFHNASDVLRLFAYNGVTAIPFLLGGTAIGLILTFNAERVTRVYAADLLGAGLGCVATPLALAYSGAGGVLVLLALLGLGAVLVLWPARGRRVAWTVGGLIALAGAVAMPSVDDYFPVPGKQMLDLTREHTARIARQIPYTEWSAISRVDLSPPVPRPERIFLGLGDVGRKLPIPEQRIIVQDGSAFTLILNFSTYPDGLALISHSLYGATFSLKQGTRPSVFIIGVGGGNDVWAARMYGASHIKGIELNPQILAVHYEVLPHYSRLITSDPTIHLEVGEGRNALMRESDRYDVLQMSGIDTWTSLTSGAYMLAENYLYTQNAMEDIYDHLKPGGMVQITRLATDAEALRLASIAYAAHQSRGLRRFADSIIFLATPDPLIAMVLKKGPFTRAELAKMAAYTKRAGITTSYRPDLTLDNRLESFIRSPDKAAFIEAFPRNISPTTDNLPYFFNFLRWDRPLESAHKLGASTEETQGNPFFIFMQLGLSTLAAAVLIILPLLLRRGGGVDRHHAGRYLVYFSGLGLGFIALEVTLMQKLTLFLGHPLYSLTVTLFTILTFTGVGSALSERWLPRPSRRHWVVPAGLLILITAFTLGGESAMRALVGLPLAGRIAFTVLYLAPVGILLGVPFAYGVRLLTHDNPSLIPWGWAVNACLTVIGSIVGVIISMNLGFNAVLWGAVAIYAIAFAALPSPGKMRDAA